MSFTQPCFIRKHTDSIMLAAEQIGHEIAYHNLCSRNNPCDCYYAAKNGILFTVLPEQEETLLKNGFTDCGTNESLFLAIAALRDDSDYMQWFIVETVENYCDGCPIYSSTFFVCNEDKVDAYLGKLPIDYEGVHKATVPELVEHFKTEEQ